MRLCFISLVKYIINRSRKMRHPGIEPGSPRLCSLHVNQRTSRRCRKKNLGSFYMATRYSTGKLAAHYLS